MPVIVWKASSGCQVTVTFCFGSRTRQSSFHASFWGAVFTDQSVKSSKVKLLLSVNGGDQLQSFPKTDGTFAFYDVPAGTHMLDVISLELVFPQVGC